MSIAFDSFVFVTTLFYTFRASQSSPRNLPQIILRDGVLYFFFILSENLSALLFVKYARVGVFSPPSLALTYTIFPAGTKDSSTNVSGILRLFSFFADQNDQCEHGVSTAIRDLFCNLMIHVLQVDNGYDQQARVVVTQSECEVQ